MAKQIPSSKKQKSHPQKLSYEKPDYKLGIVVFIFAILIYANTFNHDYALDDWGAITNNQFVQQGFKGIDDLLKVDLWHFGNLTLGYYRPLSLITFAIEQEFFKGNPHISHTINVLLYALTTLILFFLLGAIFQKTHSQLFSFVIVLVFAAHPIHTEVIANLKSRDEILSFLGVLTVLYLTFKNSDVKNKITSVLTWIVFYLAVLSKETALATIALIPSVFYFFKNETISKSIQKSIPFILVAIVFYIQKYKMLGTLSGYIPNDIVNYPYVIAKLPSSLMIFARCVKLLFFPHPLMYDYSYNQIPIASWSSIYTIIGASLFVVTSYFTFKGIKNRTIWGFALTFFFITFLPAIAFVLTRGGIMAERFLYAASLGFSIVFVYFITKFFKVDFYDKSINLITFLKNNKAFLGFIVAALVAYSFKTIDRNKAWKENFVLFETDIVYATNSCQNNKHYGSELINKAIAAKESKERMFYFHKALPYLQKAVKIHPKFGEAWCTLGVAYQAVNVKPDSAMYFYKKAIESSPSYAISYGNMGILYQSMGKYELASYYYNKAIEINPTFIDAQRNAEALRKATGIDIHYYPGGEEENSISSDAVKPGMDANYYFKTGTEYATKGNFNYAIANLQKSIELNSGYGDAYINLANCYGMLKNYTAAIDIYNKLINTIGPNARVYENMAVTYDLMGNAEQADLYRKKRKKLKNNYINS